MVQSQMAVYKGEKGNSKLVSEVFDFAWTGQLGKTKETSDYQNSVL